MTSWTEAHNYGQERDDEPPPCGGCADLQRKYDLMAEELSEVVLDIPQADGVPAVMRCTPDLPELVAGLVNACQVANRYLAELAAAKYHDADYATKQAAWEEAQQTLAKAIRSVRAPFLMTRD